MAEEIGKILNTTEIIESSDVGVANGVASLDGAGTIPLSQLPASVTSGLIWKGTWNASTNTPTLTSGVGNTGYTYRVSVAGSTNLDGVTDWQIGDWLIFDGSAWQKLDNSDSVASVFGRTGSVVANNGDYTTDQITETVAKKFITPTQSSDIVTNNAKVGITPTQASDIVTNNSKVGITPTQASDITTNNAKVGITPTQASDIVTNNAKVSFPEAPIDGQKYVRKDGAWIVESAGSSVNDVEVSFASDANPFVQRSLSGSYESVATMLFRGTTMLGTPMSIKFIKQVNTANPTHSVRIYDVTNALQIAEMTGSASTTLDFVDLGTLTNLPTGEALFAIQVKRDAGGSGTINSYGAIIEF